MTLATAWIFEATAVLDFISIGFTLVLHIKNFGFKNNNQHLSAVTTYYDIRNTANLEQDLTKSQLSSPN